MPDHLAVSRSCGGDDNAPWHGLLEFTPPLRAEQFVEERPRSREDWCEVGVYFSEEAGDTFSTTHFIGRDK